MLRPRSRLWADFVRITRKAALTGALLGLLVPLISFAVAIYVLRDGKDEGDWVFWLSPSMYVLLALDLVHSVPEALLVYSIAFGINVLLYAGIAWTGASIYSRVVKAK